MKPLRFAPCAAAVLLLGISSVLRAQAPAQASPEPASFERLDDLLSHDQIADAAGELAAIAVQAAPARPAVNPAQEEILRRAIESGRSHLAAAALGSQERRASRQLLCLARAYFEEELPEPPSKTQEAAEPLRVGGEVRRPEIVGMIKPPYSQEAREKRVSGTVILEAVIDREGCVRNSRVQVEEKKGPAQGIGERTPR